MTDCKVKSTKRKARFLALVLSYVKQDEGSQLTPMFVNYNEWLGELREQKSPTKSIHFACTLLKSKQELYSYVGYGQDCSVFNPTFD